MKRFFLTLLLSALVIPSFAAKEKGYKFTFRLDESEIYPGTKREITVFVPDAYKGEEPACLIIMMDNLSGALRRSMVALQEEGKMPVAIAIGIEPGKIFDKKSGEVIRYNRSNEFDRTDARFAEFLENEVIAELKKQVLPDGRKILISGRAQDRMTVGASSGGIAAFSAAWNRPDLFGRVYSMIGTFVPFRYGDQYPGLIRKTEPKPLRIYLQDNDEDTWNPLFGSWYEYNLLVLSALEFSGYEVKHHWDKGGHDSSQGHDIMKEVLEWLWAGWPQPLKKGTSQNETLAEILDPASDWVCANENVKAGLFLKSTDEGEPALVRSSRKYNPLTAVYPGGGLKADACATSCWIKNSIMENGKWCYEEEYYCLHSTPAQICFDTKGYLYCATSLGVQIFDHNGRVRAILQLPSGPVTSVAFGGEYLYAVSGGKLWKRHMQRKGYADPLGVPAPNREPQG